MRTALEMLAHERQRQIEKEGWDLTHDDEHLHGELARASAAYALNSLGSDFDITGYLQIEFLWPWSRDYWKPKDPMTDLVRAGALILAEIERRLRAGEAPPKRP